MPAKRAIILDFDKPSQSYRAVLWADVPAGNQIAYANPNAQSLYPNITPAELQSIRDGAVTEKIVSYQQPSGAMNLGNAQSWIQSQWSDFQSDVTAEVSWAQFGAYLDSGGAWQATTGVPMAKLKDNGNDVPSFLAITGTSAFGSNKLHFVLYNGAASATSQGLIVRVRMVIVQPVSTAVTGANSSDWTLRRRQGTTTPPSGTGGVTVAPMDSGQALPTTITAWNAPQVAPSGGTLTTFNTFLPSADEQALSTLNQPGMAALTGWAGQVVYKAADCRQTKPITLRPGEALEVLQGATAGTGNARVLVVFTVG